MREQILYTSQKARLELMRPKELKQACLQAHLPQDGVKKQLIHLLLNREHRFDVLHLKKIDTLSLHDQKLAKFMETDCGRIKTVDQYEEALEQFGGEEKATLAMAGEEAGGVCAPTPLINMEYRELSSLAKSCDRAGWFGAHRRPAKAPQ